MDTLEKQLETIHAICMEKQQAWMEFKLRFDTTSSAFNHSIEIYQQNNEDLDQLKDIQNELILLQDHIDYLLRIKSTRFSMVTSNDNLFYLDTNIEHDLSQLQINYRLKLDEINEKIEQITENKLKSDRLNLLIKSLEDSLKLQEENLHDISSKRQLDNEITFENLLKFFQQIEQIQIELKELSKNFNQFTNPNSIEHLKIKFESLRSIANDEYIHFNRLLNEFKSLNQMVMDYNELNEQINECIVNILQHADSRSRMITPEFDQRSSTDEIVQLNIYRIQVQEQLAIVQHHNPVTSKFIEKRIEQLREDIISLKEEIESILEKETETTSTQMKADRLIETLQNEFDRQPTSSSILTLDTFETYEKSSNNYFQSIHQLENELEKTIEQFQDAGLIRQYTGRLIEIQERSKQIELNIRKHIEHLRQGLSEQNILQNKIHTIIEDLNTCENELTNQLTTKEYQIEQKLQVNYS